MPLPAQLVRSRGKDYEGRKYVADLLKIRKPEELAAFMNLNGNPLDPVVQYPINEEYHRAKVPFHWSDFADVQKKLKDAMRLPLAKLTHDPEFKWAFSLEQFPVSVTQRKGVFYGTVKTRPSIAWCLRVVAVERLLGDATRSGAVSSCGGLALQFP
jgi:hypothetical protein